MKIGKLLVLAAAAVGLFAFAAPANAQMRGHGGVAAAGWHGGAWHGHPGHGGPWWHGHPGWGWRGNIAFGFYGYPYWGWGYPYGYYGYPPPPPPPYYGGYGGNEHVYDGHVVHQQRDGKDVSSYNE